mgnify:CR=1 FL=1
MTTRRTQMLLMKMLSRAIVDCLPRSIIEIWEELAKSDVENQIQVQPSLGIRYPAAVYFFVNKKSVPLANLIKIGLEKAIENGTYEALFVENYKAYIDKAQIEDRTFYQLENAFLPEETPLDRKELWFDGKLNTPIQP